MMQEVPELLRLDDSIVVQVASDLAMWPKCQTVYRNMRLSL